MDLDRKLIEISEKAIEKGYALGIGGVFGVVYVIAGVIFLFMNVPIMMMKTFYLLLAFNYCTLYLFAKTRIKQIRKVYRIRTRRYKK